MSVLTHSDGARHVDIGALDLHSVPHVAFQSSNAISRRNGLQPRQLCAALQFMVDHLHEKLPVRVLAARAGVSTSGFSRCFGVSTGISPHQWLLRARVERARQLLRDTDLRLADIAVEVGFSDQAHFTRSFGRVAGVSPGAWRRKRPDSSNDPSEADNSRNEKYRRLV